MTTSVNEAPGGLDARMSENVNTMRFRTGETLRELSKVLGTSHTTLGRKIADGRGWTLAEVGQLAHHFNLSVAEMTTALPTREEWEGRRSVRHQGLEPRTRWLGGFAPDLHRSDEVVRDLSAWRRSATARHMLRLAVSA